MLNQLEPASAETLMKQAPMTVDFYLNEGISKLDGMIEDGTLYEMTEIKLTNEQVLNFLSSYVSNCIQEYSANLDSCDRARERNR